MGDAPRIEAWNNFVKRSQPAAYEMGSVRRAAAIASQYLGLANNGGINSFLTCTPELDGSEVLEALVSIGASKAAKEFGQVLRALGVPVPSSSTEGRHTLLEQFWTENLDAHDVLSVEADEDLMEALHRHVREHEAFYLTLDESDRALLVGGARREGAFQ
jgi:hypothetical protein